MPIRAKLYLLLGAGAAGLLLLAGAGEALSRPATHAIGPAPAELHARDVVLPLAAPGSGEGAGGAGVQHVAGWFIAGAPGRARSCCCTVCGATAAPCWRGRASCGGPATPCCCWICHRTAPAAASASRSAGARLPAWRPPWPFCGASCRARKSASSACRWVRPRLCFQASGRTPPCWSRCIHHHGSRIRPLARAPGTLGWRGGASAAVAAADTAGPQSRPAGAHRPHRRVQGAAADRLRQRGPPHHGG